MENLEYIENYFSGQLPVEEISDFENKISADPLFAEEVAFYLSTLHALKNESNRIRKERFRTLPIQQKVPGKVISFQRVSIAAAAILVALVAGIFLFSDSKNPQKIADNYIASNLSTLGVTMSGVADSLQQGIQLYNKKDYSSAYLIFNSLVQHNPSSHEARRYAGLAALRNSDFEAAIGHFTTLEKIEGLYSNPGKFYHAITLLKRNNGSDNDKARALLNDVVQNDLEGKKDAESILKDIK